MSGVSLGSLKRFESMGQISLLLLTKLAMALGCADEIRDLFGQVLVGTLVLTADKKSCLHTKEGSHET